MSMARGWVRSGGLGLPAVWGGKDTGGDIVFPSSGGPRVGELTLTHDWRAWGESRGTGAKRGMGSLACVAALRSPMPVSRQPLLARRPAANVSTHSTSSTPPPGVRGPVHAPLFLRLPGSTLPSTPSSPQYGIHTLGRGAPPSIYTLHSCLARCPTLFFGPLPHPFFGPLPHCCPARCPAGELVFHVINTADMDLRPEFYKHIVLSGGSTMYPGLPSRLEKVTPPPCPARAVAMCLDLILGGTRLCARVWERVALLLQAGPGEGP